MTRTFGHATRLAMPLLAFVTLAGAPAPGRSENGPVLAQAGLPGHPDRCRDVHGLRLGGRDRRVRRLPRERDLQRAYSHLDGRRLGDAGARRRTPRRGPQLAWPTTRRRDAWSCSAGSTARRTSGDTWTYGTDGWVREHPAHRPKPLTGAMLFPDPRGRACGPVRGLRRAVLPVRDLAMDAARIGCACTPKHFPEARASAVCALDDATGQVVLFGGIADLKTDNTWTFDGSDWTEAVACAPAARPIRNGERVRPGLGGGRGVRRREPRAVNSGTRGHGTARTGFG